MRQLRVGTDPRANYRYDYFERINSRETLNMTPAGTTHYIQDLQGRLIAEATGAGAPLREYIWLDDMPLAVFSDLDTASPQLYYVHPDHLDRPLRMTNGAKALVWDAIYKPFGEVHAITGSASLNLRFPGQYFLMESGLAYNWHRHYDPTLGRYTQPDPLEFVDGPSLYAYAKSAPTMEIDPEGLQSGIIIRPRPGMPFPYPKPFDEWNKRGAQGLWDSIVGFCRAIAGMGDGDKKCPPCRLKDGTVVAVGTIAYRWDKPSRPQHGIAGEHLNLYKANQNPNNCQCFWQSIGAVPPPPQPGWIPIREFQH